MRKALRLMGRHLRLLGPLTVSQCAQIREPLSRSLEPKFERGRSVSLERQPVPLPVRAARGERGVRCGSGDADARRALAKDNQLIGREASADWPPRPQWPPRGGGRGSKRIGPARGARLLRSVGERLKRLWPSSIRILHFERPRPP